MFLRQAPVWVVLMGLVMMLVLVITAGAFPATCERSVRYDGYHLLEVGPLNTESDVKLVKQLSADRSKVIIMGYTATVGRRVTLLVSPTSVETFREKFRRRKIAFNIVRENYQQVIDENDLKNAYSSRRFNQQQRPFDHSYYMSHQEQVDYLISLAQSCPICDIQYLGMTSEDRPIIAFSINTNNEQLPAVWLDANMEAQQWITSATALYIIDQIVKGDSPNGIYMQKNFRIFILPNLNPDGYMYSMCTDRLWSKNRSIRDDDTTPRPDCTGVLLSQNFQVAFGGADASSDCRDPNYHGPYPLSESETSSMRDLMLATPGLKVYITLHSYEQQWLVPWWYTGLKPQDYDELMRVGRRAILAANLTNNTSYILGTPVELGVPTRSGMSSDWAKQIMNITYTYHVNLRPISYGYGGYIIGPENIVPSGKEIFNGFTEVCREAAISLPAATTPPWSSGAPVTKSNTASVTSELSVEYNTTTGVASQQTDKT